MSNFEATPHSESVFWCSKWHDKRISSYRYSFEINKFQFFSMECSVFVFLVGKKGDLHGLVFFLFARASNILVKVYDSPKKIGTLEGGLEGRLRRFSSDRHGFETKKSLVKTSNFRVFLYVSKIPYFSDTPARSSRAGGQDKRFLGHT